jgi:hypothetical protein
MRTMPHKPVVDDFPCLRHMAQITIEESKPRIAGAFHEGNGEFFRILGEQYVILGLIAHLFEEPTAAIAAHLRSGLRHVRTAIELRCVLNAWWVWDYLLYALAASDRALAHGISALPDEQWFNKDIKPVPWLIRQNQAVFALLRSDAMRAKRYVADVLVMTHDEQLPEELEPDLPSIRNSARLLEALQQNNATAFNAYLDARMEIRAAYFDGMIAPIALLDLHGLGLCQLARDRELAIDVRHVYLPLALLDVPPSRTADSR